MSFLNIYIQKLNSVKVVIFSTRIRFPRSGYTKRLGVETRNECTNSLRGALCGSLELEQRGRHRSRRFFCHERLRLYTSEGLKDTVD